MKLSTKTRYGVRASIEIAKSFKSGVPAKRKDIAKTQKISESYLENILLILKNSRLIKATRGSNGGYVLSREASSITLLDIISALEGPLDLVQCVTVPLNCEKSSDCASRTIWKELHDSWNTILSRITLDELLKRESDLFSPPFCI